MLAVSEILLYKYVGVYGKQRYATLSKEVTVRNVMQILYSTLSGHTSVSPHRGQTGEKRNYASSKDILKFSERQTMFIKLFLKFSDDLN